MPDKFTLTPVELELMEILWKIGRGSVPDVMEHLPKDRDLAYTSVSTILRILQQKKIVDAEKQGRQHIYVPALTKEKYASYTVKKVVKQVFSNSPSQLVSYLINDKNISKDEIAAIQKLINEKKKELV